MKRFVDFMEEIVGHSMEEKHRPLLKEMIELAWRNHRHETRSFFQTLGAKDPEIKKLSSQIVDKDSPISKDREYEPDEVVPHSPDGSGGLAGDD